MAWVAELLRLGGSFVQPALLVVLALAGRSSYAARAGEPLEAG